MIISSPCLLTVLVVVAVSWLCSLVCFSISAICCLWAEGALISIPRIISLISLCVSDATFTLEKFNIYIRYKEQDKHFTSSEGIQKIGEKEIRISINLLW